MMLISFALSFLSCVALSLSMRRHLLQVFPRQTQRANSALSTKTYRLVGWLCLSIAIALAILNHGKAVGLVYWFGALTLAALLQSLLLSYQPKWIMPLSAATTVIIFVTGMTIK